MRIQLSAVVHKVEEALATVHQDYERDIAAMGQVAASKRREEGCPFNLNDHLRGLILSMLSSQRPWRPIAENLDEIEKIFHGYDADRLMSLNESWLREIVCAVSAAKCGNRSIVKQVFSLKENIKTLRRIESAEQSIDRYVTSAEPSVIAQELANGKKYKLKQVGKALACEYLKNVGIQVGKPDAHIVRLLGPKRLGLINTSESDPEIKCMKEIAKESNVSVIRVDNLLWMFCSRKYGAICGSKPRCERCNLRDYCNINISDS